MNINFIWNLIYLFKKINLDPSWRFYQSRNKIHVMLRDSKHLDFNKNDDPKKKSLRFLFLVKNHSNSLN